MVQKLKPDQWDACDHGHRGSSRRRPNGGRRTDGVTLRDCRMSVSNPLFREQASTGRRIRMGVRLSGQRRIERNVCVHRPPVPEPSTVAPILFSYFTRHKERGILGNMLAIHPTSSPLPGSFVVRVFVLFAAVGCTNPSSPCLWLSKAVHRIRRCCRVSTSVACVLPEMTRHLSSITPSVVVAFVPSLSHGSPSSSQQEDASSVG